MLRGERAADGFGPMREWLRRLHRCRHEAYASLHVQALQALRAVLLRGHGRDGVGAGPVVQ